MASQTDLDQGGTQRQWVLSWMGPSIGYTWRPATNILGISAAGTYALDLSTSVVRVNIAAPVTITLPTAATPTYQGAAMAQPGQFVNNPITILDVGGFAGQGNPITIQGSGSDLIMGLSSIQITVNYGSYTLIRGGAGWDVVS